MMNDRIRQQSVYEIQPAIAKHLIGLNQEAVASGLDKKLVHLIKLRVSQINGCAFCQHMHITEARNDGETQIRLDLLSVWHEVPIFTAKEKAALKWAETLTYLAGNTVNDKDFTEFAAEYSESEIVNLTAVIVAINSWNRISVGFGFLPKLD